MIELQDAAGEVADQSVAPLNGNGNGKHPFLVQLGERVRALRSRRGMTRKDLARRSDASERYLALIEAGEGNPTILVLDAIARAGADGNQREAVVKAGFATRDRPSVLGTYSIDRFGDTTLTDYGVYRIADGALLWDRVVRP